MKESRVASRYGKSLLELSIERKELEKVYADMQLVLKTCESNKDLLVLLKSPIIKPDKKEKILKMIFDGKVEKTTILFIEILTRKKREFYLSDIAGQFLKQYKRYKNILTAEVTSAVGLDDKLRAKVLEIVKGSAGSEVELVEKTNHNIIGGFILKVGDKQVDASIARKIRNLARTFKENPYVREF